MEAAACLPAQHQSTSASSAVWWENYQSLLAFVKCFLCQILTRKGENFEFGMKDLRHIAIVGVSYISLKEYFADINNNNYANT